MLQTVLDFLESMGNIQSLSILQGNNATNYRNLVQSSYNSTEVQTIELPISPHIMLTLSAGLVEISHLHLSHSNPSLSGNVTIKVNLYNMFLTYKYRYVYKY